MKDGRSLDQEIRVGVWIVAARWWALGERDVAGLGDEASNSATVTGARSIRNSSTYTSRTGPSSG